jgi:hypothetical protein
MVTLRFNVAEHIDPNLQYCRAVASNVESLTDAAGDNLLAEASGANGIAIMPPLGLPIYHENTARSVCRLHRPDGQHIAFLPQASEIMSG